jgi:hypothetical protein
MSRVWIAARTVGLFEEVFGGVGGRKRLREQKSGDDKPSTVRTSSLPSTPAQAFEQGQAKPSPCGSGRPDSNYTGTAPTT